MKHRLITVGYIKLLALQLTVIAIISLTLWGYADKKEAYSALMGGLICVIPGFVFARNVFKYRGAQVAKKIVARLYWGEVLKLGLTFMLFTLAFIFIPLSGVPFFVTFIATQMVYWLAPLVLKT